MFVLHGEFVHGGLSGSACGLVGCHMHAADGGEVVDGLQSHDHLYGCAVRVADYPAGCVEGVVAVDFGYYQRHVGIHAEG